MVRTFSVLSTILHQSLNTDLIFHCLYSFIYLGDLYPNGGALDVTNSFSLAYDRNKFMIINDDERTHDREVEKYLTDSSTIRSMSTVTLGTHLDMLSSQYITH